MRATLWNREEELRHRRRNLLQSALLLGGMMLLLAVCGWIVAGGEGVLWTVAAGGLSLYLSPRASPWMILRLYRGRRLHPAELPELFEALAEIARRAGLDRPPQLHYIPSPTLNAFAVGNREQAAIAVTDGMLRRLNLREMIGVLAHEVSHIANNDLWVMGLADTITRLTRLMSLFGLMILLLALPLVVTGEFAVPWLLVGLLVFAPNIGALLQLALSRTREYDADLHAAGLTGDALGLASALEKMERLQGRFWEDLFLPGRRRPDPSLLRTHPETDERIRRLLALQPPAARMAVDPRALEVPPSLAPVLRRPRWHPFGLWH